METKWDKAARMAWNAILEEVVRLYKKEAKTYQEIADIVGVGNRAVISEWIKGNRKAEKTSFANLMNYLERLGIDYAAFFPEEFPTIKRVGTQAPVEEVKDGNLPQIPVLGSTGAGNAVELFSEYPEYLLPVLPQYFQKFLIGLVVDGDSMEPTIKKGAIVGIIPFDGILSEGGIYLVHMPPFGRVIKRVKMANNNKIELHSDNKLYSPVLLEYEGYENIILGKVIWIWQQC